MEAISSYSLPQFAISRSLSPHTSGRTQHCTLLCRPPRSVESPRGVRCWNRGLLLRNKVKLWPFLVASAASGENGVSGSVSAESSAGDIEMVSFNKELASSAGSVKWIFGPASLVASMLIPQFFLIGYIETAIRDEILSEILASFSSELLFYVGMGIFLYIAKHVQHPYRLNGRWSLIADHNSYLYSSYLTMGLKVFTPLLVAYLVWPVVGLPAAIAVAPFLLGLAVQYIFEDRLRRNGSSCWPLLPIIFEVYRLYQLNRGAHFVERLLFSFGRSATRELLERRSALFCLLVAFQAIGLVCIWSLSTFLLRLIPSQSIAES